MSKEINYDSVFDILMSLPIPSRYSKKYLAKISNFFNSINFKNKFFKYKLKYLKLRKLIDKKYK